MKRLSYLLLFAVFFFAFVATASASHFRFGHTTWNRVSDNPDGSVTVEFTLVQAWRLSALDWDRLDPGDGTGKITAPITEVGSFTDINGEQYGIRSSTFQHTYSAAAISSNSGVFFGFQQDCCRIGSLKNAGSDSERMETIIDLNDGNTGSPSSSIPVILQMGIDQVNNIVLPIADADRDPFTCRMATNGESLISSVAQIGANVISVSSACTLSWDTTGGVVGDKYAVQVVIEENNAGAGAACNQSSPTSATVPTGNDGCGKVALDFIVELVDGTPPTCDADVAVNNIAFAGETFQATFTGTDPDSDDLTGSFLSAVPAGSTLNPPSGTTQTEPASATFSWTIPESARGSAVALTFAWQDEVGLQGYCPVSIEIPLNNRPTCDAGGPYNVSCGGPLTNIELKGSGTDPDQDALNYSWSTDCGAGASLNSASSQTPTVSLSDPGQGNAVSCTAELTVDDGRDKTTCTAEINVDACRDECTETDLTPTLLSMDGNGLAQAKFANKNLRRLKRKKKHKSYASAQLQQVDELYLANWSLTWSVPEATNICTQTAFCVNSDNTSVVNNYDANAQSLLDLTIEAIGKRRLKRKRRRKLLKQANNLFEEATEASAGVPLVTSNCP